MAIVTGALIDFGLQRLTSVSPTIYFTPSRNGIGTQSILAARPIPVVPLSDGIFSVDLAPNDGLSPDTFYSIQIEYLDPAGNYVRNEFPDWELFVPAGGGTLQDLLRTAPPNVSSVWVGPTPPPQTGTWWLNTSTGDLSKWSN